MLRFIRLPGIIAFAAVIALMFAVWYLTVDSFAEYTVEKTGTRAVGAKVEVSSADFCLFPMGLEIKDLQVTNPRSPMRNAVVAERVRMRFDTWHLIKGRKVVEEMSADGIAFDRERRTSGAVGRAVQAVEAEIELDGKLRAQLEKLAAMSVKGAKEILEKEELSTIKEAGALQEELSTARERFKERLNQLPDEEKFEAYEKRLREIRKGGSEGGVFGAIGTLDKARKLKEDIQADINALQAARKEIEQSRDRFRQRLAELRNAPSTDAERLLEKYSLSPEGIGNMAALVFGPEYAGWMEAGLTWYLRLSPYLAGMARSDEARQKRERGEGIDVIFSSEDAVPEYWIKTARLSLTAPGGKTVGQNAGQFSGQIKDLSSNQPLLGLPLTFSFSGEKTPPVGAFSIDGRMDRTDPSNPEDMAEFRLKGYKVGSLSLLDQEALSIVMGRARVKTAEGKLRIAGKMLEGAISAEMKDVSFDVTASDSGRSPVTEAIAEALAGISGFDISTDLGGSLNEPDIRISSSIDDALKQSLTQSIAKQRAQLESQLKSAIMDRTEGPLQQADHGLASLRALEEEIAGRIDMGRSVLPELPAS